MATSPTTTVGSCHHDCPDTCVWEVAVDEHGKAVKLRGSSKHPTTAGQLCPKVNRYLDRVYHPDRLLKPQIRSEAGTLEPASWDDALALVARKLGEIVDAKGPQAICQFSFDGTQGVIQKGVLADRFFDVLGATDIRRHLCGVSAWMGAAQVSGLPFGIDPEDIAHSRTILLWGTNTFLTNRHLWPTIETARANGAHVTVIDPVRTATADRADEYLAIKPGTDVALVLAMIHALDRDGRLDQEWLANHTSEAEELLASAAAMSPDKAAAITGIPERQIEALAARWIENTPSVIRTLVGPEHRRHGREIMRALSLLPAVTGAWRERGGGQARSTQVYFEEALNYPDRSSFDRPEFNMAQLGAALNGQLEDVPAIDALVVHNSNPAVIVPDSNAVVGGLKRDDLFTVVIEQFMTDTAHYADVVLPATTQIEHLDLGIAWGHLYLSLNQPAIAPVGEAKPNTEIFRLLAQTMKLEDPIFAMTDEELIRELLDSDHEWLDGITYERLATDGWARLNVGDGFRPYVDSTPDTTDGRLRLGSIDYSSAPETPDDVALATKFPLVLMSRKQHPGFLNANYGGFETHQPMAKQPFLEIHPDDAVAREITSGDKVRVFNDRGSLTVAAAVSEVVQPGMVSMPFGWWHRSTPEGRGVNALTNPSTPDGQGSAAFNETLVQVLPL